MKNNIASVLLDPASHEPIALPTSLTVDTGERNNLPSFSPDGQSIAYRHMLQGASSDIWLMDTDGENAKPLTSGGGYQSPHWLPGGERIAFSYGREILALTLATGRIEPFHTQGPDWGYWTLSYDGATIAFHADRDGSSNVWTIPVGGDHARQLTFSKEGMSFPSWSRDGRYLALQLREGPNHHIAVMPSDGGEPIQLTSEPGQSWPGANSWSPNGDKIAFAGLRDEVWNVWWVSTSDGTQKKLTDYKTYHHYVRYPAWSPSGDQLVYEYSEVTGDIWLVDLP